MPSKTTFKKQQRKGRKAKNLPIDLCDLTPAQQRFTLELMCSPTLSQTEAAEIAGYKNPAVVASQLMANPKIGRVLSRLQRERNAKALIKSERILEEVDTLALRDPIDLCDENGMIIVSDMRLIPERMRRCIDGIKVKSWVDDEGNTHQQIELKLCSKVEALRLSMLHRGMLTERKQVNHTTDLDWDKYLGENNAPTGMVIDVTPEAMQQRVKANLAHQSTPGRIPDEYRTPTAHIRPEGPAENYTFDDFQEGE